MGLVGVIVTGWWLNLMLETFSNLNDRTVAFYDQYSNYSENEYGERKG